MQIDVLSVIGCQLSVVSCQLSVISCLIGYLSQTTGNRQLELLLSIAYCVLSIEIDSASFILHTSYFIPHPSVLLPQSSYFLPPNKRSNIKNILMKSRYKVKAPIITILFAEASPYSIPAAIRLSRCIS